MGNSVRLTAEEFQKKHATRTKAAIEDLKVGVDKVTEAPGMKAAAKEEKMKANLNAAIDSGKWKRRVASVSLEEWKKDMKEKGAGRVSAGLDRSAEKVKAFASQLIDHENRLLTEVSKMPDLTLEDSISRSRKWIEGMAGFEYKR